MARSELERLLDGEHAARFGGGLAGEVPGDLWLGDGCVDALDAGDFGAEPGLLAAGVVEGGSELGGERPGRVGVWHVVSVNQPLTWGYNTA